MKCRLLLFSICLLALNTVFAQRTVSGEVINAETGQPMIQARVVVTGTTTGTLTDGQGKFSIQVPDNAQTLTISSFGYSAQEVSINGMDQLKVNMRLGTVLDEVVVTALGVEEKKTSLSYATQRLKTEDFNASRVGDISQQIAGRVPGLAISTNNGSGVSSSRIVLRGEASLNINKNQPLIVVDGVVVSNNLDGIGGDATSWSNAPIDFGNGLTDFNTDDIQDITVLKGPKAAALYGARAANGALVIRTKSGLEKQGLGIEFNTGFSVDALGNFWDEQTQYGGGFDNEFRVNWGGNYGAPAGGQSVVQPTAYELANGVTVPATPYNKSLDRRGFFDTGISTNNNLALSFADENVWGRVSVARLDKTGIVPNTEYKRNNIGLRLGANATDKLSVDVSANYVNSFSGNLPVIGGGGEGVINNMFWGMNNFDYNDYREVWLPGQEGIQQNYFLSWGTNPWLIVEENLNKFNRNRIFGNVKFTYMFSDELSLFVRAGTDFYSDRRRSQRPSGQPNFPNGMYREQGIRFTETNIDFLFTYNKDLTENIGLRITAGANRMDQSFNNDFFETRDLGVPGVYNKGNVGAPPVTANTDAEKRINSVYGSARIDLDDKIYLDVTGRNDWSSALPTDNNSFFYPSVGVSAILSEMLILPSVINFAQLRGSWAATGNDTDPLLTERVLSFGSLPSSVVNPRNLVNPELKPERTSAVEVGMEVRLWNSRLTLDVNYYSNITTDQILQVPISQASGASTRLINAGEIKNSGVEVFLTAKPIVTKDFSWDISLAWSRNRGEVVELADGVESFVYATGPSGGTVEARPGDRMGDIYGRGFARSPEGDVILDIVNVNGVDIVRPRNGTEVLNLGNYNPDWSAGLTNTFRFRNISLNVFFDYRSGGNLYTYTSALLYRSGIITESLPFRESTFVPQGVIENPDGSFSQNTIATTGQDWYRANFPVFNIEANTYDNTWLKLREISLGADLKDWIPGELFENLYVGLFGRNLWIDTKSEALRHFDPESLAQFGGTLVPGFEVGQLPSPRTFGINVKVGL
ncbi:MAG: SusC/RagA family TonB-linked outer membrane protein [Bacteroidota bacterium]